MATGAYLTWATPIIPISTITTTNRVSPLSELHRWKPAVKPPQKLSPPPPVETPHYAEKATSYCSPTEDLVLIMPETCLTFSNPLLHLPPFWLSRSERNPFPYQSSKSCLALWTLKTGGSIRGLRRASDSGHMYIPWLLDTTALSRTCKATLCIFNLHSIGLFTIT